MDELGGAQEPQGSPEARDPGAGGGPWGQGAALQAHHKCTVHLPETARLTSDQTTLERGRGGTDQFFSLFRNNCCRKGPRATTGCCPPPGGVALASRGPQGHKQPGEARGHHYYTCFRGKVEEGRAGEDGLDREPSQRPQ